MTTSVCECSVVTKPAVCNLGRTPRIHKDASRGAGGGITNPKKKRGQANRPYDVVTPSLPKQSRKYSLLPLFTLLHSSLDHLK